MSYNGLEIDMLNVGDADCILVTHWNQSTPIRTLIDGGDTDTVEDVRGFLRSQGINRIDNVVCTHPHDDHAGGLVELLKYGDFSVGTAWIHRPQYHINMLCRECAEMLFNRLEEGHGHPRISKDCQYPDWFMPAKRDPHH